MESVQISPAPCLDPLVTAPCLLAGTLLLADRNPLSRSVAAAPSGRCKAGILVLRMAFALAYVGLLQARGSRTAFTVAAGLVCLAEVAVLLTRFPFINVRVNQFHTAMAMGKLWVVLLLVLHHALGAQVRVASAQCIFRPPPDFTRLSYAFESFADAANRSRVDAAHWPSRNNAHRMGAVKAAVPTHWSKECPGS